MNINCLNVDYDALPDGLLAIAKAHIRVDGNYEDDFIRSCIARSIGSFEERSGAQLNKSTWTWTPALSDFCSNVARVPVTPVTSFVAELADDTVVTSSYTITTPSVSGVPILYLNGAYQSGVMLTLEAGFTVERLPPSVLDRVLRVAAHLHEHREILIPGSAFVAPDFETNASWWVPRL